MFRIAFFVEDDDLSEMMKHLTKSDMVVNMEVPKLVELAKPAQIKQVNIKPKARAKKLNKGPIPQPLMVLGRLIKNGKNIGDVVTTDEILHAIKEEKIKATNVSPIRSKLVTDHFLRMIDRGRYVLNKTMENLNA